MDANALNILMQQFPFHRLPDANGQPGNLIVTCPVRLVYCGVDKFYPSKKYPTRTPEASVAAVIPPNADPAPFQQMAIAIATAHWGDALNRQVTVTDAMGNEQTAELKRLLRMPWRSQKQKAGKPGYTEDGSGLWFRAGCNATYADGSPRALPRVIGPDTKQIPNDSPAIYSGMWARLVLKMYPYPKKPGDAVQSDGVKGGINLDLMQIQKVGDDEPTYTATNLDNAFGDLSAIVGSQPSKLNGSADMAGAGEIW